MTFIDKIDRAFNEEKTGGMVFAPSRWPKTVVAKLSEEPDEICIDGELRVIRGELEKCAKASQLLVTASDNLRQCFGTQITITLCSDVLYYIIILYLSIKYLINPYVLTATSIETIMVVLISHVLSKVVLINAGQRAQNEGENLYRNICTLRNLLLQLPGSEAGACARAAAGLARRLRAAPLRVRLLSARAVQMALLADILALVADNTIVLLQFNHVV